MSQSYINILAESKLAPILSRNVFSTLMVTLICTLIAWYAQYHWKRRKLYQTAAKINGPLTLPIIGNAWYFVGSASDAFNKMLRLSTEFESPVRMWFGQKLYFGVWGAKDMETIMNSPQSLKKGEQQYKFSKAVIGDGLLTSAVPKWRKHRRMIMPAFNQRILDDFVEVFSEHSTYLIDELKKKSGKGAFEIDEYLSRCILDIVCETAMGCTVNALTTESEYFKWINTALDLSFKRIHNIIYHFDFIFKRTSMAEELQDVTKKIDHFIRSVITAKRTTHQQKLKDNKERPEIMLEEESFKRKPFLQLLIELSEEGEHFTDDEVLDEVNALMAGGSHTTAGTDSFVFIMLGMFPHIQDKVYKEVIDVLGPDRPVESKDLKNLQYLERVIKETMRIFPVGPIISRDITGDLELETCTIPAGSSVMMSIIGSHRDPNVWPNPLQFDPDRFLPEEVAKRHPYSWLPFSAGPRNCVGLKYAMMSMKTLLATVIRKYRVSTDYKSVEDIKLELHIFMRPKKGYRVSIESRE